MSQLKVYKASAGSGKTFRLAIEYMKLALTSESNYRHILAVTFTNKATAEMKSRIIGELYHLASGKDSVYMDVLKAELGWNAMQIERQAQLALKRILHDYSRFSISTIDSFFQRVIKAFNRELGINAAFNVELDEMGILEEAADRLIQSVEDDAKLLEWLDAFASEKMRDGRGWNLKKDIVGLGAEIYNETFKSLNEELYEKLNDRAFLRTYREKLNQIVAHFEGRLKKLGQEGLNVIAQEGLSVDDFKSKNRGPAAYFQKLKALDYEPGKVVIQAGTDISAWVTATVKEPVKSQLTAVVQNKLMPKVQEALQIIETDKRNYISAKLIINQLYTLGILVDLRKAVKELCREKGIVLISDSGHLLKEVIADSETPFVYEKTGSVYSHFMIDEFQDTSGLQWNNFRPLIGNSLSEDNLGLVVGDVKQAIYRWRSGDWRLLAGKLGESFPAFGLHNEVLNSNWRSHGQVIRFNNSVFQLVPKVLQLHFDGELAADGIDESPVQVTIPEVYADSVQQISNKQMADIGFVRVKFWDKKSESEDKQLVVDELIYAIKSLQDKGVKAKEIAILVRQKKEARNIADLFLEQKSLPENLNYNFDILSGESLYVNNSDVIRLIISVLTCFLNPDNQVVKTQVSYLFYQKLYPKFRQINTIPDFSDEAVNGISADGNLRLSFESIQQPNIPEEMPFNFEEPNGEGNDLLRFISSKSFQEMVSGKPILEIIYSICERLNLFSLTDELAYLQAFVDQISVFERSNASELTSFLNWWSDNGDRFTIPVSESIDAINVLTIHKSKGLEFEHVFIPFFDWNIQPHTSPEMAPLLWCKPETDPFNEMELVPVRFKSDVGKSIFYREYFTEKFNTYIDNLNLMYVAFTRAKESLYIWAPYTTKLTTVGDLLKFAVDNQNSIGNGNIPEKESIKFDENSDQEKTLIEIGTNAVSGKKSEKDQSASDVRLSNFEFSDFRKFLNIRKNGEDFFSRESKRQSGINKGKIIHEILSLIETVGDLPKAVKRIETDGKISSAEATKMIAELSDLLADSEVKNWFDGSFRVVNERNILTGENGIKRPDRIMIGDDRVVVVDYKSGDVEADKYKSQLRSYIRALVNCGFRNVSGYIWYTKMNKRVKV